MKIRCWVWAGPCRLQNGAGPMRLRQEDYAKRNGGADSRKVAAKKGRRLGGLAPSDACCTTDIVIICPPEACNIEMRLRWISCHINMEIWRNFRFAMFCGGAGRTRSTATRIFKHGFRRDDVIVVPSRAGIAVEDRQRTIHRPAARRAERTANRSINAVSTNENCAMGRLLLILDGAIIGPVEFLSSATKFSDAWSPIIRTTPADSEFAAAYMRDADNWLIGLPTQEGSRFHIEWASRSIGPLGVKVKSLIFWSKA